jgi:hypothetical protein
MLGPLLFVLAYDIANGGILVKFIGILILDEFEMPF